MTILKAKLYPNGCSKSQLFESVLNYFDFDIPKRKDFVPWDENIQEIRKLEIAGKEIAEWELDFDGKKIVANLILKDPFVRIEITETGFKKIPIASRRAPKAREKKIDSPETLNELFTPRSAVPDPLQFFGRAKEVSRVINEVTSHGKFFAISGQTSLGKTSFLGLIEQLFKGNSEIEYYYNARHNCALDGKFKILKINASKGLINIEKFAKHIYQQLSGDFSDKRQLQKSVNIKIFGLADIGVSDNKTITTDDYIQNLCQLIETYYKKSNKRIVLLFDELDSYNNPENLSSLFRNLSGNGCLICVAGSSKAINSLLSGHP